MKKILLPLILCSTFLACSKKDAAPVSASIPTIKQYFKGKINGISFYDFTLAHIVNIGAANELQLIGYHATGGITLWVKAFNYNTGERLLNESNTISVGNNGKFYYAGSITAGKPIQGSGKINILEINASYVKGTFECIAPADTLFSGPVPPQVISEGEFNLKR